MQKVLFSCLFFFFNAIGNDTIAQVKTVDTLAVAKDSIRKKAPRYFNPHTATIRSAILPGLGQIYNKKYWKVPIVYGALGTTAAIYLYNINTYRALRQAYVYITDTFPANNVLIDPRFSNLSPTAIRSYRDSFRQNIDYAVLFFLLFWGLNVVDAAVDAHLKAFDVNDNLSLQIKPGHSSMANTNGISLVLNIGKRSVAK
jgi:hypothetical protein